MSIIKKATKFFLYICPDKLYSLMKINDQDWTDIDRKREVFRCKIFCVKLVLFPERVKSQVAAHRKIIEIKKGEYNYNYFNMCFLNNMMSLILYILYNGGIPRIVINEDDPEKNKWNWYFKQPEDAFFAGINTSGFITETCDTVCFDYTPRLTDIWSINKINKKRLNCYLWKKMYSLFAILNDEANQYIESEVNQLGVDLSETLGVLYRGTDYTATKPKFHPVQPSPDDLINIVISKGLDKNTRNIYCATDEKCFFDYLSEEMKKYSVSVLSNRNRDYYDSIYYGNDSIDKIGQVHFARENDNYLKGIRYLSSIIILSRCKQIIAASSGGTFAAMMFRKKRTNKPKDIIINLGLY